MASPGMGSRGSISVFISLVGSFVQLQWTVVLSPSCVGVDSIGPTFNTVELYIGLDSLFSFMDIGSRPDVSLATSGLSESITI